MRSCMMATSWPWAVFTFSDTFLNVIRVISRYSHLKGTCKQVRARQFVGETPISKEQTIKQDTSLNMWLFKSSQMISRRNLCNSSIYRAGFDLLSLEKGQSPAREGFYFDFLYGIHPISCAIEAKRRSIETVFYRRDLVDHSKRVKEILERCWAENIPTQPVTQNKIDSIMQSAKGKPHQGMVAKTSRLYYTPTPCTQEFIAGLYPKQSSKPVVWLLLSEIQDPMNFGSILRTAYFLGCDKVFITSHKR